jgi:protein-tyrosine phosphatase
MTHIPLEGALNLRDIGGYTADGGTVRRGLVFRSDNLNTLTDNDLATINALGIRSVFDFRGDREVELQPSRLWDSVDNHVHLPIAGDTVQEKTFVEMVEAKEITEVTDTKVGEDYVSMLEDKGDRFATVLRSIVIDDHGPILFHCTAGKDRTGLAAAIIHGLCGVSRQDIVSDYEMSNALRLPSRQAELTRQFEPMGIDIEPLLPAISAPPKAMHMALDHLESTHGSVTGYVVKVLGIAEQDVNRIRSRMIV